MATKAGSRGPRSNKRFGIQTTGVDRTARALKSIGGRGADARPAWPHVFDVLRAESEDHFNTRGHGEWEPLAKATHVRDKYGKRDPRMMRASGALFKSLHEERAKGSVRRKSKLQMRFGTTVFYATFHQEGRGVPKRRVLEVHERVENRITDLLEEYVAKGELVIKQRRAR
jgi:phage gpG-like protein